MALSDVLVHQATVTRTVRKQPTQDPPEEEWIEGEYDVAEQNATSETPGQTFDCILFLGSGQEAPTGDQRRGRNVRRPTLLYEPEDVTGAELALSAKDRLAVTAEEITGPDPVLWDVDGSPEPFAKPGELIGFQAKLVRVSD